MLCSPYLREYINCLRPWNNLLVLQDVFLYHRDAYLYLLIVLWRAWQLAWPLEDFVWSLVNVPLCCSLMKAFCFLSIFSVDSFHYPLWILLIPVPFDSLRPTYSFFGVLSLPLGVFTQYFWSLCALQRIGLYTSTQFLYEFIYSIQESICHPWRDFIVSFGVDLFYKEVTLHGENLP